MFCGSLIVEIITNKRTTRQTSIEIEFGYNKCMRTWKHRYIADINAESVYDFSTFKTCQKKKKIYIYCMYNIYRHIIVCYV